MSRRNPSSNNSTSAFSELQSVGLPGFLFVDHIAIAVCAGELESQLKMYQQLGFRELHREEMGDTDHIGFRVKSAQAAFDYLKAQGFRIIDAAPRPGSRGTTVFFIHPKSHQDTPFWVLYEVVEDPDDAR